MRRSEKRDAIFDAALELFAERGFHGTAVPEIARRAEVGAGTIYRYFDSKEALVNALFQHWKGRIGACVLEDFPVGEPLRTQFRHFWKQMAAFALEYPTAMAFLELHHHADYLDEGSRAIELGYTDMFRQVLAAARGAEVVKDLPPELLMHFVHGAFVGLVKAHRLGQLVLSPDMLDAAESCAWEAIRR